MNILLVDDDEKVRQTLDMVLRLSGLNALHAGNGEEALAQIETADRINLVLLDIDLPKMNGFEVLRRLKSDPRTRSIPVIMLTGRNELEIKVEALSLGAADYLTKPFDIDDFRNSIRRVLSASPLLG